MQKHLKHNAQVNKNRDILHTKINILPIKIINLLGIIILGLLGIVLVG